MAENMMGQGKKYTAQLAATDISQFQSCYALSIIPFWPRLESVGLLCRALVA